MPSAIVVGGGLAGLTAAWTRVRAGGDVVLLEESARAGGVVRSERRDGYLLESGPNTVRPTPPLVALLAELGLQNEVGVTDPKLPRFVDFGGRLHALPSSPGALLGTALLSLGGKLRLLGEPLRRSAGPPEETVFDFFQRRLGREVAERIVTPFVAGIFAGDAGRLSLADAFPSVARWERSSGSIVLGAIREARTVPAGEPRIRGLLSLREGLEALPRALARALGPAWRPETPALSLARRGAGWRVETTRGPLDAEELVLAVPAHAAARLVRPFEPEAADALEGIPHPFLAVLHLAWPEAALPAPLNGFGQLVVPTPSRRILGAVWSSCLFPGRAPEGQVLLTVFLGGARDPDAASLSDDALVAAATRDLEAEGLTRGAPRVLMITRWPRAIPQYERGHAARIEALARAEARCSGLRFLGNYRGGVSVGDVIRNASDSVVVSR